MRKSTHGTGQERGIALLTVITALVALMVIAVPFALQMRKGYERSKDLNAHKAVRMQADSVLRFLEAFLVQTTRRVEVANRRDDNDVINNDPEYDSLKEITPTREQMALALGVAPEELRNPYGTILGWEVQDENGKLNINSVSPFALGNLLGLSVITQELRAGESTITLDDASAFPPQGYVKIGRELVKYTGKRGNSLVGCERNVGRSSPFHGADNESSVYSRGQWVLNYAAWAIAYYRVGRHPGEITRFDNIDVSDIALLTPGLDPEIPVITRAQWEIVERFVTAYSKGELADGFVNPRAISEGTSLPGKKLKHDAFTYASGSFFNSGTVLMITERADTNIVRDSRPDIAETLKPRRRDYVMCFSSQPSGRDQHTMRLYGKAHRKFIGNQAIVWSMARQPVNINTAPREVLVALFANLQLKRQSQTRLDDRVTPGEAALVADEIIRRRNDPEKKMRSMREFRTMLGDLKNANVLSRFDRQAIFRNAQNSNDGDLRFGTAPICFKTFDVYTLVATATASNSAGRRLARHRATRVVEIGSQVTTSRSWETQRQFEEQLVASMTPRYWVSGPKKVFEFQRGWPNLEPPFRWRRQLNANSFPWDPYDQDAKLDKSFERASEKFGTNAASNGDIRLASVRATYDEAWVDPVPVVHFDGSDIVDGRYFQSGYTFPKSGGDVLLRATRNGAVQPFSIQFWIRPQSGQSGDRVLFDYGESAHRNRYTCFIDAARSELVFRVSDNTAETISSELRFSTAELQFTPEVWYHIQLVASGCHPSMMQMFVDGRAVGKPNLMSYLKGDLAQGSSSISLEDGSAFPPSGAVLVGAEVVEYEANNSGSLTIRRSQYTEDVVGRGARGTIETTHADGTPVVLLGYSRVLLEDVLAGGASVSGSFGPWAIARWNTGEDLNNAYQSLTIKPSIETRTWSVSGGGTGGAAGGGGGAGGGGSGGNTSTNYTGYVIPNANGEISGFNVMPWGADTSYQSGDVTWEKWMEAFQPTGYCYMVYIGGTQQDWAGMPGTSDNIRARVEFMKYTWNPDEGARGLRLERVANNDGAQGAPMPAAAYEIMTGYRRTIPQGATTYVASRIWIIPISVRTTQISGDKYLNPINEAKMTHAVAQIMAQNQNQQTIWEWFRYREIISQGGFTYFLQDYLPNERPLIDRLGGVDWDVNFVSGMTQAVTTANPGGGSGESPGGGSGGGGSGGGGGTGGGGSGGGGSGDGGSGGGGVPQQPPDPQGDGGGGEGGGDPGSVPDPQGDGPGGEGGGDPGGDVPDPEGDGPGGEGDGGNPEGNVPDPQGDGGGGEGSGDPGSVPDPQGDGGGGEGDGSGGGGDGGGGGIPPDEGGTPPSGGGGSEEDTGTGATGGAGNTDSGGASGGANDQATPDAPPGVVSDSSTTSFGTIEVVANLLRFRGVQADWDQDGLVDDFWRGTGDNWHHNGAGVYVMIQTYGGVDPTKFTQGVQFGVSPQPGIFDRINLVSGDDQTRVSGLMAFWAMNGTDQRLKDDTDNDGQGDTDPWEMRYFSHVWALNAHTNERLAATLSVDPRSLRDNRQVTRVLATPSSEFIDNIEGLSQPSISRRFDGTGYAAVIDEVLGATRDPEIPLFLSENLGVSTTEINVVNREGQPAADSLPRAKRPGILKIGNEIIVYESAELVGNGIRFRNCIRGTMRSQKGSYDLGTQVEVLFGVYVAILDNRASESTNVLVGKGFDNWASKGCARLENPETGQVELRIFTLNRQNGVQMPVGDTGSGFFVARYGTTATSFAAGTPVFAHPIRFWDRFAEYQDHPEMSFWSFSTQFADAFVKRVWWEETAAIKNVGTRVYVRMSDGVPWNSRKKNVLLLSGRADRNEGGAGMSAKYERRALQGDMARFLWQAEDPRGDNSIRVQANQVECRLFVVYYPGCFDWNNLASWQWKTAPKVNMFGIEYIQQNRVRRHIDRR